MLVRIQARKVRSLDIWTRRFFTRVSLFSSENEHYTFSSIPQGAISDRFVHSYLLLLCL